MSFTVKENGELFYICNSQTDVENLVIPNEVDGIKVTSISEKAFQGSSLKNVIIPEGITSIGDYAFYSCKNLENVIVADSVAEIGSHAFDGCDNLKNVRVPESLKEMFGIGNERIVEGYKIINSIKIGDSEIVLGVNKNAPDNFVTWECKNGNDCYWGHYCDNIYTAQKDFGERIHDKAEAYEERKFKEPDLEV